MSDRHDIAPIHRPFPWKRDAHAAAGPLTSLHLEPTVLTNILDDVAFFGTRQDLTKTDGEILTMLGELRPLLEVGGELLANIAAPANRMLMPSLVQCYRDEFARCEGRLKELMARLGDHVSFDADPDASALRVPPAARALMETLHILVLVDETLSQSMHEQTMRDVLTLCSRMPLLPGTVQSRLQGKFLHLIEISSVDCRDQAMESMVTSADLDDPQVSMHVLTHFSVPQLATILRHGLFSEAEYYRRFGVTRPSERGQRPADLVPVWAFENGWESERESLDAGEFFARKCQGRKMGIILRCPQAPEVLTSQARVGEAHYQHHIPPECIIGLVTGLEKDSFAYPLVEKLCRLHGKPLYRPNMRALYPHEATPQELGAAPRNNDRPADSSQVA